MSEFLTLTDLGKHEESYYKPLIDEFNEGLKLMFAELVVQSASLSVNVKFGDHYLAGWTTSRQSHWRKLTAPAGTRIKIVKASYTAKGLGFWINATYDPYNCFATARKKAPSDTYLYGYHVMYPTLSKCVDSELDDILKQIHEKGIRILKPQEEKVMEFVEIELPEWGSW